ncbi:MAG: tetratricopeptide repeat protein [Bryobacterales bacterium]|nr:tetratricopeptide repeat protein [Bryobacterales bacterium]
MARLTRKELKTDRFAEGVGAAVGGVLDHKKEVTRYGIIAAVVVVLIVGGLTWYRTQAKQRRADFDVLLRTMEAPIAPPGQSGGVSYATEADKEKAVNEALEAFSKEHSGTNEDALAHYFLASNAVEDGNLEKALSDVEVAIKNGDSDTAAVARFLKGNILASQGKSDEAEKIYRDLLNASSGYMTKGEVTIALAKLIGKKNPDEAIKLLEPMRLAEGSTQRIVSQAIEEIRSSSKN